MSLQRTSIRTKEGDIVKRALILLCALCILSGLILLPGFAEEKLNMRIVECEQWVSLRKEPSSWSERIMKVPLGAVVEDCVRVSDAFYRVHYGGRVGYILSQYLSALPYSGAWRTQETVPYEMLEQSDRIILRKEYNEMTILASLSFSEEGEVLRVDCYHGREALWGWETGVEERSELQMTAAFMGGTIDSPCVLIYNGRIGLTCVDLMTGEEQWFLSTDQVSLGASVCNAVADDGTIYIAGFDGPDPVAIAVDGSILWAVQIEDEEIFHPIEIRLTDGAIETAYECGDEENMRVIRIGYDGRLLPEQETTGTDIAG